MCFAKALEQPNRPPSHPNGLQKWSQHRGKPTKVPIDGRALLKDGSRARRLKPAGPTPGATTGRATGPAMAAPLGGDRT